MLSRLLVNNTQEGVSLLIIPHQSQNKYTTSQNDSNLPIIAGDYPLCSDPLCSLLPDIARVAPSNIIGRAHKRVPGMEFVGKRGGELGSLVEGQSLEL